MHAQVREVEQARDWVALDGLASQRFTSQVMLGLKELDNTSINDIFFE